MPNYIVPTPRPMSHPDSAADSGRTFLTRVQATHALGLMCASQKAFQPGVVLAMRHPDTGTVYEAEPGEVLHAQIALRVGGDYTRLVAGWTVPADTLQVARA